ncbi:MAG: sigma-54 dependent transcriptional regulator [Thermodesulfobacteriota bacterium]
MIQSLHPIWPILLVDDEEHVLISFDTELRNAGYSNILSLNDSREVMGLLAGGRFAAVLLDLWMPHVSGLDLLARITADHPEIPVIVVTGLDQVETAVTCMKNRAFDYLVKPVESGLLTATVEKAIAYRELGREVESLRHGLFASRLERPEVFKAILTHSDEMFALFRYVEAIAPGSQPVLVTGETGVGKELLARAIHATSGRKGPFVPVDVAGLDDTVFADTLFGHRRGAFTGADQTRDGLIMSAAGGTLFLDEIGDLSPVSQVKLLRLAQEREYTPLGEDYPRRTDARLVVATNQPLPALIEGGRFRKDLYYRLNTHHVHVPPLRCRLDDLPLLVDHFLESAARDLGKKKPTPPPELFTLLAGYGFPGNVRELRALVYDAVSRHSARVLSLDRFREYIRPNQDGRAPEVSLCDEPLRSLFASCGRLPTLNLAADLLVAEAMKRVEGNITQAAGMLGITRQALSKRLKRDLNSEDM